MKFRLLAATICLISLPAMAQQKKQFTLDELMGSKYWSIRPYPLFAEWWGDQLVTLNAVIL